jgi:hypothetical protein
VNVVVDGPPMWREIAQRFPASVANGVVYTWSDTIFNPAGGEISDDLFVHEAVHAEQQEGAGGPESWWKRYLIDPAFVLDQEARAYGRQFAWIRSKHPNRGRQARELHAFARVLSSPMYGTCTTYQQALKLIRSYS